MSFNWDKASKAIRQWLVQASGTSNVIFENQPGPRPASPFLTVLITSVHPKGAADEIDWDYLAKGPAGNGVRITTFGQREVMARIQAVTPQSGGDHATSFLARCQSALALETIRNRLNAAGLACFDRGTVRDISAVLDTKFEYRAIMEPRFYCVDSAQEFIPFVEEVKGSGDLSGSTNDPLTVSFDIK